MPPPGVTRAPYTSAPVLLPSDFLAAPTDDVPIKAAKIDFSTSPLPEYAGLYAVVLDNVLSAEECNELLRLTELSAGAAPGPDRCPGPGATFRATERVWKPALVSSGPTSEFFVPEYRNSDRIIWDQPEVVRRLWERCLRAEVAEGMALGSELAVLYGERSRGVLSAMATETRERWVFSRLNERMRFLRYGPGQYFRSHCDGAYETPDEQERSFFTLHLYLNDSAQALRQDEAAAASTRAPPADSEQHGDANELELLRGGATTFHSMDEERRLDVDPKAGRVLIFQQRGLLHSGDEVVAGVKYTMRTDVIHRFHGSEGG